MASQWRLEYLTATFAETTTAVVTLAGRAIPEDLVVTQGHVLSVGDLLATLVVEARTRRDHTRHCGRPIGTFDARVVEQGAVGACRDRAR